MYGCTMSLTPPDARPPWPRAKRRPPPATADDTARDRCMNECRRISNTRTYVHITISFEAREARPSYGVGFTYLCISK